MEESLKDFIIADKYYARKSGEKLFVSVLNDRYSKGCRAYIKDIYERHKDRNLQTVFSEDIYDAIINCIFYITYEYNSYFDDKEYVIITADCTVVRIAYHHDYETGEDKYKFITSSAPRLEFKTYKDLFDYGLTDDDKNLCIEKIFDY